MNELSQASFVERLTACQQPLFSYINALLAGDANGRDVLQETNIELWLKADQYDPEKPFLPWAYRFAYYRVLNYRKSQGASKVVFSDEVLRAVDEAHRATPETGDERLPALAICLTKLQPSQRDLIRLRYEEGCPPSEIARLMGATEDQVGGRLYRVRRLLHECIARQVRQLASQ
jgi:RNA polymerase sigma-70 factor (ECF subfamily)